MLRRSDFIAATYALSLVFANFGIAIAARMPMMTTTIRSSISVKRFFLLIASREGWVRGANAVHSPTLRRHNGGSGQRKAGLERVIWFFYLIVRFEVNRKSTRLNPSHMS